MLVLVTTHAILLDYLLRGRLASINEIHFRSSENILRGRACVHFFFFLLRFSSVCISWWRDTFIPPPIIPFSFSLSDTFRFLPSTYCRIITMIINSALTPKFIGTLLSVWLLQYSTSNYANERVGIKRSRLVHSWILLIRRDDDRFGDDNLFHEKFTMVDINCRIIFSKLRNWRKLSSFLVALPVFVGTCHTRARAHWDTYEHVRVSIHHERPSFLRKRVDQRALPVRLTRTTSTIHHRDQNQ